MVGLEAWGPKLRLSPVPDAPPGGWSGRCDGNVGTPGALDGRPGDESRFGLENWGVLITMGRERRPRRARFPALQGTVASCCALGPQELPAAQGGLWLTCLLYDSALLCCGNSSFQFTRLRGAPGARGKGVRTDGWTGCRTRRGGVIAGRAGPEWRVPLSLCSVVVRASRPRSPVGAGGSQRWRGR